MTAYPKSILTILTLTIMTAGKLLYTQEYRKQQGLS